MNDPKLYELISLTIEEKLRRAMPQFTECFPHITTLEKDGLLYRPEENALWTASFFPGMLYLAYDRTGNTAFLADVVPHLKSFRERLEKRVRMTHDLGFLYTLSCVALYKLTGNQEAKELAQQAADLLAERYNEKGHFIQAWGDDCRYHAESAAAVLVTESKTPPDGCRSCADLRQVPSPQ